MGSAEGHLKDTPVTRKEGPSGPLKPSQFTPLNGGLTGGQQSASVMLPSALMMTPATFPRARLLTQHDRGPLCAELFVAMFPLYPMGCLRIIFFGILPYNLRCLEGLRETNQGSQPAKTTHRRHKAIGISGVWSFPVCLRG